MSNTVILKTLSSVELGNFCFLISIGQLCFHSDYIFYSIIVLVNYHEYNYNFLGCKSANQNCQQLCIVTGSENKSILMTGLIYFNNLEGQTNWMCSCRIYVLSLAAQTCVNSTFLCRFDLSLNISRLLYYSFYYYYASLHHKQTVASLTWTGSDSCHWRPQTWLTEKTCSTMYINSSS